MVQVAGSCDIDAAEAATGAGAVGRVSSTVTGSVYHQDQVQISRNDFIGTISSGESTYKDVRASWADPLTFGGSYRIDLYAIGNDGDYDPSIEDLVPAELYKNYTTRWQVTYRQSLLRNLGRNVNIWRIKVARNSQDISEEQFRQTVLDTVAGAINQGAPASPRCRCVPATSWASCSTRRRSRVKRLAPSA